MHGTRTRTTSLRSVLRTHYYLLALVIAVAFYIVATVSLGTPLGPEKLAIFAPLIFAAIASTPSILSGGGGIDLSIGPNLVLANLLIVAVFIPRGMVPAVAVVLAVLVSALVGALNGALAVLLRLSPVVVTLAMYFVLIGTNQKLAPTPVTLADNPLRGLASTWGGVLPWSLLLILLPLVMWGVGSRTRLGRSVLAVGGSDATAFSAGVNVPLVRIGAYAFGGFIAGLGGVALTALVSSADAGTSSSYTLVAIAAVALGGTSMLGGRGGLLGSAIGAICVSLIQSVLSGLQLPTSLLKIVYGGLLLASIMLSAVLLTVRKDQR